MFHVCKYILTDFIFFLEPNAKDSWLLGSIIPVTTILVVYLAFVLKIGPEFMRFRKPLNINRVVTIYNVVQILFSSYLLKEVRKKYSFRGHII